MRNTIISLVVFLTFSIITFSQVTQEDSYRGGLIISISNSIVTHLTYETNDGNSTYTTPKQIDNSKSFNSLGLGIHYSGNIISEIGEFEFRPGLFFSSYYIGPELGVFFNTPIYKSIVGTVGVNFHYNVHFEEGNSSGYSTEDGLFINPSIGIGFKAVFLSFDFINDKRIYSSHYFNPNGPSTIGYQNISGILKLNLNISEMLPKK